MSKHHGPRHLVAIQGDEPTTAYMLIAYQLDKQGEARLIEDPSLASTIGRALRLGYPTDPLGFAIWEIS